MTSGIFVNLVTVSILYVCKIIVSTNHKFLLTLTLITAEHNPNNIFNYLYRMRKSWKRNLRHSDVNGRKRLDELSLTVAHHEIHPL